MKKALKTLSVATAIMLFAAVSVVPSFAQEVDCDASLVPPVCRIFAGSGSFSVSTILTGVFSVVIAALVIFILFQIVKAVFAWVQKANDEKARGEAIKSITNAVIAGVVLLVSVVIVIIGVSILGVNIPSQYACYEANKTNGVQGGVKSSAYTSRGTLSGNNFQEIPNVQAVEGTGNKNLWSRDSNNNDKNNAVDADVEASFAKVKCVYINGDNANQEFNGDYVVAARIGLKK